MMVGLPTETQEDVDMKKRFLEEAQPEETQVAIFTPYAGCDIYHRPKRYKYVIDESVPFDQYIGAGKDAFTPVVDKGKQSLVHERKRQLMETGNFILDIHKDRWENWEN